VGRVQGQGYLNLTRRHMSPHHARSEGVEDTAGNVLSQHARGKRVDEGAFFLRLWRGPGRARVRDAMSGCPGPRDCTSLDADRVPVRSRAAWSGDVGTGAEKAELRASS
jgi:hypothetical protein